MMVATQDKLFGWHLHLGKVEYQRTLEWQHGLVRMREQGFARDTIITVEHPPVLTVGRDGHPENFAGSPMEPIRIERGGDVTYHGPGQLVIYFIFNIARRGKDLHSFMDIVQNGLIRTLAEFKIRAGQGEEHTGVWVDSRKIASVGIAVQHWITFHGAALNVNTDLNDFTKIQPCGLSPDVMTSIEDQVGRKVELDDVATRLVAHYTELFATEFAPVDLDSLAEDVESQAGGYEI